MCAVVWMCKVCFTTSILCVCYTIFVLGMHITCENILDHTGVVIILLYTVRTYSVQFWLKFKNILDWLLCATYAAFEIYSQDRDTSVPILFLYWNDLLYIGENSFVHAFTIIIVVDCVLLKLSILVPESLVVDLINYSSKNTR